LTETCENPSDHPEEDLAKSGYKSNMIYKSLIILLYIWLPTGNQNIGIWQQVPFPGISFLPCLEQALPKVELS